MSFAVDTNILLRSIDDGHIAQPIAQKALFALRDRREILSIFPQNLVEFWAVATRPLANNGLGWSVDRAKQELTSLKNLFVLLSDTDAISPEWERLVVSHSSHRQTSSRCSFGSSYDRTQFDAPVNFQR